jgi:predicted nucleotide-binding protein
MTSFAELADQVIMELVRQENEKGDGELFTGDICRRMGITNASQIDKITDYLAQQGWVEITIRTQQLPGAFANTTGKGQIYVENLSKRRAVPANKESVRSDPTPQNSKVFVVHGRNGKLRRAMFEFLRAIGLRPMEWSEASNLTGKPAPYIGEILDLAFKEAQAIVVLMTGDDEAKLRDEHLKDDDGDFERNLTPQARPNVLFEAGMAFGTHPDRTVLVEVGRLRPFSDVVGREVVRLANDTEKRQRLAQKLKMAGCAVNLEGTDWHTAGDFSLK